MAKKLKMPSPLAAGIMALMINGEMFGRAIRNEFEKRYKRSLPLGSLYATLDRMEKAGFVEARIGETNPKRGSNHRRYFWLTAYGRRTLEAYQIQQKAIRRVLRNV